MQHKIMMHYMGKHIQIQLQKCKSKFKDFEDYKMKRFDEYLGFNRDTKLAEFLLYK